MSSTNGQVADKPIMKAGDDPRPPAPSYESLGVPGLKQTSGRVNEEWLSNLKGRKGVEVYREMRDNDPIAGSVLFAMEHTLRGVGWYVTPFSDPNQDPTEQDEKNAQFLSSCMHDMSITWPDFIAEVLSKLVFGW